MSISYPIFLTGWENGVNPITSGGALGSVVNGTPLVQNTVHRSSGNYALQINTSSAVTSVAYTFDTNPATAVGVMYFNYAAYPSVDNELIYFNPLAGTTLAIKLGATSHQLFGRFWSAVSGSNQSTVIALNTWYRLDFRFDASANPNTIDFSVNGVAAPQTSYAQAATTLNAVFLGTSNAGSVNVYYDDLIISGTSTDYPMGDVAVQILLPTSDGTSVPGTVIANTSGTVINDSTNPAWSLLDEIPANSTADYVEQTATGSGNYAEVNFADTTQTNIVGVMALVGYHSSSTTANAGTTNIHRTNGTDATVYSGDMSEVSIFYKRSIISAATGAYSQAEVNGMTGRIGYSTNVAAIPYWDSLSLEVAYVPPSAASGTLSATLGNTTLSSAVTANAHTGKLSKKAQDVIGATYQNPNALARFTTNITGAVCYVSHSGLDTNSGTEASPFRTIQKGWSVTPAGGVCYVKDDGVYTERPYVSNSGTSTSNMVNVIAYPGQRPILDAESLGLALSTAYILMDVNYTFFSGFEVRNSGGWGIHVNGQYDVIDNCYVHHIQNNGIFISGDYSIAQYNWVWRTCLDNEYGTKSSWASACSAGRGAGGATVTTGAILRGNWVWENWGEGVSCYNATAITIEGNYTHDNFSANLYASDVYNVTIRQNMVWMSPESYMYSDPVGSHVGIMLGAEVFTPVMTNITITDNIAYGNFRNFYWFVNNANPGDHMDHYTIANNTFVNSHNVSGGYSAVHMSNGLSAHVATVFENNVVIQDDSYSLIFQPTSVTYSGNVYDGAAQPTIMGTNDYYAQGGSYLNRSGNDQFLVDYYKPLSNSPVIGRASVLSSVPTDFSNYVRDASPDSGALEYLVATGTSLTAISGNGVGLNVTLDNTTNTATGKVDIHASLSSTLGDSTSSSAGQVLDRAALSQTLLDASPSAAGGVLIQGSVATQTLGDVTNTITAQALAQAVLTKTLDSATETSAGTVLVSAQMSQAVQNVTLVGQATLVGYVTGTLSVTLGDATLSSGVNNIDHGTATHQLEDTTTFIITEAIVSGSLAQTLDSNTFSSTVMVRGAGTVSQTLDSVAVNASAIVNSSNNSVNVTLENFTGTSTALAIVGATLAATLLDATGNGTGTISISGSLVQTLGDALLNSNVANSGFPIHGVVSATLDNATVSSIVKVDIKAAGSNNLGDTTLLAFVGEKVAVLSETLNDAALSSATKLIVKGMLSGTLAGVSGISYANGSMTAQANLIITTVLTSSGVLPINAVLVEQLGSVISGTPNAPTPVYLYLSVKFKTAERMVVNERTKYSTNVQLGE